MPWYWLHWPILGCLRTPSYSALHRVWTILDSSEFNMNLGIKQKKNWKHKTNQKHQKTLHEIKEIYILFQNEKATLEWLDGISVYILNPLFLWFHAFNVSHSLTTGKILSFRNSSSISTKWQTVHIPHPSPAMITVLQWSPGISSELNRSDK